MITVIIPALNEAATIAGVVSKAKKYPQVNEVIVVDDASIDETARLAKDAGAIVITSNEMGKGISMRDGLQHASNDIVAFIDADIPSYPDDLIEIITKPLLHDEADFVKSFFDR